MNACTGTTASSAYRALPSSLQTTIKASDFTNIKAVLDAVLSKRGVSGSMTAAPTAGSKALKTYATTFRSLMASAAAAKPGVTVPNYDSDVKMTKAHMEAYITALKALYRQWYE